jgi:hypothetical protein
MIDVFPRAAVAHSENILRSLVHDVEKVNCVNNIGISIGKNTRAKWTRDT